MIEFIKEAAGIRSKMSPAAFSMLLYGAYFTYPVILALAPLAPETPPPPRPLERLILPYGSGPGEKEKPQHDYHRPNHRSGDLDSVVYGDSGRSC
jgi:hypothetical protein